MKTKKVESEGLDKKEVLTKVLIRFAMFPPFMGLILLLPAGTFDYWEAYVYIGIISLSMLFIVLYFMKHDPSLLERRMKVKEEKKPQKLIIALFTPLFIAGFILAGFDQRYNWSDIAIYEVFIAELIVLFGYYIIFSVFRENSFASRVIEVNENQKVISTGLYSKVRHPMYVGVLIMYIFSAPALGSWWAIIPFVTVLPVVLVLRILNEEKVLKEELPGYIDYCNKTKYRLIPYIW
jgi:protein-S-isoprenylcysteine O-methyltransferase Ste14